MAYFDPTFSFSVVPGAAHTTEQQALERRSQSVHHSAAKDELPQDVRSHVLPYVDHSVSLDEITDVTADETAEREFRNVETAFDLAIVRRRLTSAEWSALVDHHYSQLSHVKAAKLRGRTRATQTRLYHRALAAARSVLGVAIFERALVL